MDKVREAERHGRCPATTARIPSQQSLKTTGSKSQEKQHGARTRKNGIGFTSTRHITDLSFQQAGVPVSQPGLRETRERSARKRGLDALKVRV